MSVINAPFARNRMCVAALVRLGPTANNLLDRMLSPDVRLATSTPGGRSGWRLRVAVFARAEAMHPGAEAALSAKALLLLGGPGSMAPQPERSAAAMIFLGDHAMRCSTSAAAQRLPRARCRAWCRCRYRMHWRSGRAISRSTNDPIFDGGHAGGGHARADHCLLTSGFRASERWS